MLLTYFSSLSLFPKIWLRLFFIFIYFNGLFLFAQELPENNKPTAPAINLSEDVVIYSADENFNKSIVNKDVIVGQSLITIQKQNDKVFIIASVKSKVSKPESFSRQVNAALRKKEAKRLAAVQKLQQEFNKKDKTIYQASSGSSNHILSYPETDYSCFIVNINQYKFSKIGILLSNKILNQTLHYLFILNDKNYNDKVINFCFSKVFYLRPPPVIV